jgi:hypothetical protein
MQIPKKVREWIRQIPDQVTEDFRKLRSVWICFLVLFLPVLPFLLYPSFVKRYQLDCWLLVGVILGPLLGFVNGWWQEAKEADATTEKSKLYLQGMMQRYSLLFSVNGGAFAIVQFSNGLSMPGVLSRFGLSVGLILFTVFMVFDIWLWGSEMRQEHSKKFFRPVRQMILLMIGGLLVAGWILIGVVNSDRPCVYV